MVCRRSVVTAALSMAAWSGWASPALAAGAAQAGRLRRLRVLSLGPAPLEVPPAMAGAWVARLPTPPVAAARGLLLLSGILVLAALPDAQRRAAEGGKAVGDLVRGGGVWSPGLTVADEVVRQLRDGQRVVAAAAERALPGAPVEVYANDPEAYMQGVRQWWGATRSDVDHADTAPGEVDAVVEVVVNYAAFYAGALTVHLWLKLIDPASRAVIGRAREHGYMDIAKPEDALADDARQFKQVFGALSAKLVHQALRALDLHPA